MKYHKLSLVIVLLFSLFIAACANSESDEGDNSGNKSEMVDVSLQFAWIHEYSSAPFYAAVENGRFEDANINVTLIEGGFGENGYIEPIAQVVNGESQFGLATSPSLIEARAEGQPVVAVMTVLQRGPFALISLSDDNINIPQDLVGKTVAVSDGSARMTLEAMLAEQGLSTEDVNTVSRATFGIEPLINGEIDVLAAWINNEGIMVREAGFEPNFILMSDYGIDTYDFVVFTTQDMVDNHPETVDGFVDALLAGMHDVISDPDKAIDYTMKYGTDLNRDEQFARLQATLPLMNVPNATPGLMDDGIWAANQQLLLENDVIDSEIDLSAVFTNRFVEGS